MNNTTGSFRNNHSCNIRSIEHDECHTIFDHVGNDIIDGVVIDVVNDVVNNVSDN
jgi:hypothetical protein